ncbi:MAG: 2-polyprenyl-6-hydroxyphenyl methylase/3-demethylubiquinone-9 3-methyltransferase [Gammaproteobacteria bacterium]|jgi:2-polyprenyl-6-hydroxyphenyl methylase/3-demethylubiquinone-9 3-methyltransferase
MSNVNLDPAEIDKFQALASRWWDRESEFKPLHDINPLRVDYIDQFCDGLKGKKVLDIGCGGGILTEAMCQRGAEVTGIDMGEKSLSVARLHLHESKLDIDYQMITAEDYAEIHENEFDIVTCLEMLEHVPVPESIVNACAKLVKPQGKVFFSTINRNPKSFLFAIVGAEYVLNLLPRGTHEYQRFIKPSELSSGVRQAGMEVMDITGMTYNPITKIYKLGRDLDVNYLMACNAHA